MQHFTLKPEEYVRDLDIVGNYMEDSKLYLNLMTGAPLERCEEVIKRKLGSDQFKVKNPELMMLERGNNGDKAQAETTFLGYLNDIQEQKGMMAPTLTVYHDSDKKQSLLSEYTLENVNKRNEWKHLKFTLGQEGDKQGSKDADILQSTCKVKNNSISGAHVSQHNILCNKSSHSSLTSTCRTATAYANSNNERFLAGNRHYYAPSIAINNIVSIMRNSDYDLIAQAVDKFNIHLPTPEEVMEEIKRSTDLYWNDGKVMETIEKLVTNASPLQRAAYHYSANMWTMKKHNEKLIYDFLDRLSTIYTDPVDDPDAEYKRMDADLSAFISVVCNPITGGVGLGKLKEKGMAKEHVIVASTIRGIVETLDEFAIFIKAFWVTKNPPSSIAAFTGSIRRVAMISDTDSTIFTTQDWVNWFMGGISFNDKATSMTATITYLASMTTIHLLAQMSTSIGVKKKNLNRLAMKNEFLFPVLIMTSRAKHYTSYISVQEGNVYDQLKLETKGVALKNSKLPKHVIETLEKFIRDIMDTVMRGEQVSVNWAMQVVADMERSIVSSIEGGDVTYLSMTRVNPRDSYKNPMSSAYRYDVLWNESFGKTYGAAEPPPYQAVKISTTLTSSSKVKLWLENMKDRTLAENIEKGLMEVEKQAAIAKEVYDHRNPPKTFTSDLKQILVPLDIVSHKGIPKEILEVVDYRKLIATTMEGFYLILESLHLYVMDPKYTRLISDTH